MKLLISIVAPYECAVFSRWPDYLDVKNPSDGSLGMPRPGVIRAVREFVGGRIVISAAIGDASDDAELYSKRAVMAAVEGADIIKVGLFSFSSRRVVVKFLQKIGDSLKDSGGQKKIVPAVYADVADKNLIGKFPRLAREAGAWGCLIDTFDKTRGSLSAHLDLDTLKRFTASCRENGVVSALAGGLRIEDFDWLSNVNPDVAGFRSAVASTSRAAVGLSPEKLENLFLHFNSNARHNVMED